MISFGTVGVGKTRPATALGDADCLNGHSVRFTIAVDVVKRADGGASNPTDVGC